MKDHSSEDAALAAAFAADASEGETEPIGEPKWVPPVGLGPGSTSYSIYDWWFASKEVKDQSFGYWSHLYEWRNGQWVYITKVHGADVGQAFKASHSLARALLIEGQRPEAQEQSHELDVLVKYWQANGFHLLARDNKEVKRA